jgi:hypothetical protein
MSVTRARSSDFTYIHSLAKKHAEELGFLTTETMRIYLDRGDVQIAQDNGDPVGFFLHSRLKAHTRIFQACVQIDARGLAHGIELLSDLVSRSVPAGTQHITLHCRDGLPSNAFWSACGFALDGSYPGGKSKGKVICCWRLNIADALRNPSLPYASDFLKRLAGSPPGSRLQGAGSTMASAAQTSWLQRTIRSASWQAAETAAATRAPRAATPDAH